MHCTPAEKLHKDQKQRENDYIFIGLLKVAIERINSHEYLEWECLLWIKVHRKGDCTCVDRCAALTPKESPRSLGIGNI